VSETTTVSHRDTKYGPGDLAGTVAMLYVPDRGAAWTDYLALLKPRVMSLVIFTALVGMVIAPGALHPVLAFTALLCIAFGAGASGALNMWYDADIDAKMARTAGRPIPQGRISREDAAGFGAFLALASIAALGLVINWLSAGLLALTIGFYLFVYTMWLKRRTAQNIVIGGAAGALPPVIGWAAVTGSLSWEPVALFLIIFLWTPPHFWALALYRTDDYARVGVPMLPVVSGAAATRTQILLYTVALVAASALPVLMGFAGLVYAAAAILGGGLFLWLAAWLWLAGLMGREGLAAKLPPKLFGVSIFYLFALFAALLAERIAGIAPLMQGGLS
jgi:protoheme IX farnesyltransferase